MLVDSSLPLVGKLKHDFLADAAGVYKTAARPFRHIATMLRTSSRRHNWRMGRALAKRSNRSGKVDVEHLNSLVHMARLFLHPINTNVKNMLLSFEMRVDV